MLAAPVNRFDHNSGFTLLEVIAVLLIISILVTLTFPNFQDYRIKASEAVCMGNMRSIIVGLHGYLQDNQNVWPQGPTPNEEILWEKFWLETLEPYGILEKTWQCPAMRSALSKQTASEQLGHRVHYVPTLFNAEPAIATRWATQPWLIERTSMHKQGALIAFPDGSIKSFYKVLAEQGIR